MNQSSDLPPSSKPRRRTINLRRGVSTAVAVSIGGAVLAGCGSTASGGSAVAVIASPQVTTTQGGLTSSTAPLLSASGGDRQGQAFGDWIDVGDPGERVTVHRTVGFTDAGGAERLGAEIERCAGLDDVWRQPPQADNWFIDAPDGFPLPGDSYGPLVQAPGASAGGVVLSGECKPAWVYFDRVHPERSGDTTDSVDVKLRTSGGQLVVWRGPVQPESSLTDSGESVQVTPSSQSWETRDTPTLRADLTEIGWVTGESFNPEGKGLTLTLNSAKVSPAGDVPRRVAVELTVCSASTGRSISLPTLPNLRLMVLDRNDETYGRQAPELATLPAHAGEPLGPGMTDHYAPTEVVHPGECSTGWVSFHVGDADLTRLRFQIFYEADAQIAWSI